MGIEIIHTTDSVNPKIVPSDTYFCNECLKPQKIIPREGKLKPCSCGSDTFFTQ